MTDLPPPRTRARDLGFRFGTMPTGPLNAVTDVPDVKLAHVTRWSDAPVARTGVTALVVDSVAAMFHRPLAAGTAVLNGAGELTGSVQIDEWGMVETPVLLTATSTVGRAYDACVDAVFAAVPGAGIDDVVIPVVGECDDSWLDEVNRRHVTVDDCRAAIEAAAAGPAGAPVVEGSVGAGAGMISFGYKAGIGTASRVLASGHTVGVLLLANFGRRHQLRLGGVAVGERLAAELAPAAGRGEAGSCIGVVVTDAPFGCHDLTRVARRVGLGLARVGSVAHHGSGEIFLALSTGRRHIRPGSPTRPDFTRPSEPGHGGGAPTVHGPGPVPGEPGAGGSGTAGPGDLPVDLDEVFAATVDATEEAVVNALFTADTVVGRDGNTAPGLPVDRILGW